MKHSLLFFLTLFSLAATIYAQPYWSLTGNAPTGLAILGTTNPTSLNLYTNSARRMTISTSGNVGIGTVFPLTKFHVNGLGSFGNRVTTANAIRALNLVDDNAVMRVLRVDGKNAPAVELISRTSADGANIAYWDFYAQPSDASFRIRDRFSGGAGLDRVTIGGSGNVGVGTTAPLAKLHLNVNGGTAYSGLAITNTNTGGKTLTINQGTNGKLNFTEPAVVDLMTLDFNSKNVGIGTTSPAAKLHVVGSTTTGSGIITSGYDYGLQASSTATYGYGIYSTSNYCGVYGSTSSSGYYGTYGSSGYIGAYGNGTSNGTYGLSSTGSGAYGISYSGRGVDGYSTSGYGGNFSSYESNGLVARTTNGSFAGAFYGYVYSSLGYITSDKNLKKDIHEFGDAMSIINKLKPQNYLFKDDAKYASLHLPKGRHYGLLAQDLEQVLPNLVLEAPHELIKDDKPAVAVEPTADGTPQPVVAETKETKETINIKAVNYVELIPIMVKAMQEQQSQMQLSNAEKDEKIADLQNQINDLKSLISKNGNSSVSTSLSGYMKQNAPNPANNNTVISYYTPDNTRNAQILVTDMKGRVLRAYNVSRGEGQLNIRSGELPIGTYNYTLYINSNRIDTKQMIIAK